MAQALTGCMLIAALSFPVLAQTGTTRSEQEVLQAVADLRTAILKQDAKALNLLIDDTYLAVRVDGTFNDKAGLLKNNQTAAVKYDVYENQGDAKIRIHGDTAVVVSDLKTAGRNPKGEFKENRRATSVWVKRDGRWKMVAAHMGQVP